MDFSFLLIVIIVIAAVFIILILVRRVFAILALLLLLFTVLLIVTAVFVVQDFKDFQKNANSPMLFLLEKNDRMLAGFWTEGQGNVTLHEVEDSSLAKFKEYLNKSQYELALNSYYKMFIIQESAFDSVAKAQFAFSYYKLTKEECYTILEADNPGKAYADILVAKGSAGPAQRASLEASINKDIGSAQTKAMLFGILFSEATKEDTLFLYKQLNNNTIEVYPETMMFKAVKTVPVSFVDSIMARLSRFVPVKTG